MLYGDGPGHFDAATPRILDAGGRRRQPDLGHRSRLRRGRRHRPGGHRPLRERGECLPKRRDELRPASHPDPRRGRSPFTPRRPTSTSTGRSISRLRPRASRRCEAGARWRPSRRERTSWPASSRSTSWWRTSPRDGRPDVAVVNRDSSDVSILLGTGCTARRLELTQQPAEAACLTGPRALQPAGHRRGPRRRRQPGVPGGRRDGDDRTGHGHGRGRPDRHGELPPRLPLASGVEPPQASESAEARARRLPPPLTSVHFCVFRAVSNA